MWRNPKRIPPIALAAVVAVVKSFGDHEICG
jgi:hypothetical protein